MTNKTSVNTYIEMEHRLVVIYHTFLNQGKEVFPFVSRDVCYP